MMIKGRVWIYGDDVNTDVIFPGKYTYTMNDPHEMATHAMEDLDPEFAKNVRPADIIIAGKNFGCGSSREQAATCLKYAGIAAVIAKSFSRIFFRNAINSGLPPIECKEEISGLERFDSIEIDFSAGKLFFKNQEYRFIPIPAEVQQILNDGGLVPHLKKKRV